MKHRKMIIVRLTLVLLVTTATASWAHKKESPKAVPIPQEISRGDTLILLKPLEVASGRNAVYFQQGQVVEKDGINAGTPYCRLELTGPAAAKLTIQPQHFGVTNVTYDEKAQGQAGELISTTYLALKVEKGGAAKRIACRWPGASASTRFLSPQEIGAALAGYFSIEVPD